MKPNQYRIAHLADTHLGYRRGKAADENGRNQRSLDVEAAFTAAIDGILEEHEAEPFAAFVHAGDVFESMTPAMPEIRTAAEAISRLKRAGIPQLWINGNHDTSPIRKRDTALTLLATIYRDEKTQFAFDYDSAQLELEDGKLTIEGVAWDGWEAWAPNPFFETDACRILVAHGNITATDGTYTIDGRYRDVWELPEELAGYHYIAAGHLHLGVLKVGENVYYPGSTERFGWRDAGLGVTGWLDVCVGTGRHPTWTKHAVPSRPMIDLGEIESTGDEKDLQKAIERALDSITADGAIVRLLVTGIQSGQSNRLQAMAKEAAPWAHSVQIDYRTAGFSTSRSYQETSTLGSKDLAGHFQDFLAEIRKEDGQDERWVEAFSVKGAAALAAAIESDQERTGE